MDGHRLVSMETSAAPLPGPSTCGLENYDGRTNSDPCLGPAAWRAIAAGPRNPPIPGAGISAAERYALLFLIRRHETRLPDVLVVHLISDHCRAGRRGHVDVRHGDGVGGEHIAVGLARRRAGEDRESGGWGKSV